MSIVWKEVFSAKASIYTLDRDAQEWRERGKSGTICIYFSKYNKDNVMMRWTKSTTLLLPLNWKLLDSRIKPKGERAWVIKAISFEDNKPETIALRFSNTDNAAQFSKTYKQLTPNPNWPIGPTNIPLPNIPMASTTQWRCTQCTFENNIWSSTCVICCAPKQHAAHQNMQNIMCSFPHTPLPNPQQNAVSKWICSVCTYDNDVDALKCIMCTANPTIPTWNCTVCTLPNLQTSSKCEACNTSRNGMAVLPAQQTINGNNYNPIHKFDPFNISKTDIKVNCDEVGNVMSTEYEFKRAACHIALRCDDTFEIFKTLMSVIDKLATKHDPRYRTLDTTNPKVVDRLLNVEGVVEFLALLGFESDAVTQKLHCIKKPHVYILRNAMNALSLYQMRFGVGRVTVATNGKEKFVQFNQLLLKMDEVVVFGYVRNSLPIELIQLCAVFYLGKISTVIRTDGNEQSDGRLSIEQIVDWATNYTESGHKTMETIIITHKTFTNSIVLLKCLRKMFVDSISEHRTQEIRCNILRALQMWITAYWKHDFMDNHRAKKELTAWFEELLTDTFEENITNNTLKKLISSISNQYNSLKVLRYKASKQRELVSLVDDKNREKDELLLCGYIRNECWMPLELSEICLRFYHENIEVSAKMKTKFDAFKFSAEDLANQLTLIDKYIFDKIDERECLDQNWKKKEELSPNIRMMIQQFNNLTLWVQIQILRQKNVKLRTRALGRIIKLNQRFLELKNYNSLCAVYSALNSAPIHHLRDAWKKVSDRYMKKHKEIKAIFDRSCSHRSLRRLLRSAKRPCIPHIGLMLQDLVCMDDRGIGGSSMRNTYSAYNYVNYNKLSKMREVIQSTKSYQKDSYHKIFKEDLILQKLLLMEFDKLKEITEDEIWDMSTEIKRQDSVFS